MLDEEAADEGTGAGAIAGYQAPLGLRRRKAKVDELLRRNPDIHEGHVLAYMTTLDEGSGEAVGRWLDLGMYDEVAGWVREHLVREWAAEKVREVVRRKPGSNNYVLYSPNKGKKKKAKAAQQFPSKLAAKRAELARFPPKDPQRLARLRKTVKRMAKKPERPPPTRKAKYEGVVKEDTTTTLHSDPMAFFQGLKSLPQSGPQRGQYVTQHMSHGPFLSALQKHPQGQQIHRQLTGFLNSPTNAGLGNNAQVKVGGVGEAAQDPQTPVQKPETGRSYPVTTALPKLKKPTQDPKPWADIGYEKTRAEGLLRAAVASLIKESLFREERSGSAWDEVIARLSSKALTGDKRFQSLQRNIEKRTQSTLEQALAAISKGVKDKHTKVFGMGVKHSPEHGKIYLPFNVELDGVEVGPIAVYVEAGVPRIELSDDAKVSLTKADPALAKELRANLILVQERVLDRMDDLTAAIEARDRYLEKLEDGVDSYVAGLTPLQLSLMKRLLTMKYRKQA